MKEPKDVVGELQQDSLFTGWSKQHPHFLSHFFCQVDNTVQQKADWEIGYYDEDTDKIEVFVAHSSGFEKKPEDQVFKRPDAKVEKLDMGIVTVPLSDAVVTFKEELPKLFPSEEIGDGFLILQTFEGKTVWNFSFITKSVKFVNIKIDAGSGDVASHETVTLVQK